ncbi:cardiolipin synthetase [Planctomycetes bacterium Poly30]|uniref:Cardiolipin synthetase n=1 Tax=Saltatorellus ferox TaxID=2528018 RepID=A0A518EKI4_9BACT|nr:cardiolipin synthetase [Planctomycetes bacterium Poly30]
MRIALTIVPLILSLPVLTEALQERSPATLRLVESFPAETTLDAQDLPQTADVWLEMIRGAEREVLLSHFYAATAEESVLNPVIEALKEAAARGVRVRMVLSKSFEKTYPEVPAELAGTDGIEVRFLDFRELGGGIVHAKYMVVDAKRSFLGSQNFDFRAMDQIQELGVEVVEPTFATALAALFDMDWRAAGHEPQPAGGHGADASRLGVSLDGNQADHRDPSTIVTLCGSPRDFLPGGMAWDLPLLVELIEGAKKTVRVQVLTYDATGRYDPGFFHELEGALRSAAARGVRVQVLVADWCKREGVIDGLQSLNANEGIDVSFVVIPESSEGFVPFSRVAHAKLCVADEDAAWIGTSNWERSYFTQSRNVSVILEGTAVASRLAKWFDATWNSPYREPVLPGKTYEAPKKD